MRPLLYAIDYHYQYNNAKSYVGQVTKRHKNTPSVYKRGSNN